MLNFGDEPIWPEGSGPRVVVEAAEWADRELWSRRLASSGFAAIACPGPEGLDMRCPLAAGHGCRAVEEADAVLHLLGHADVRNGEVLSQLLRRGSKVVVAVPAPVAIGRPRGYEGAVVVTTPAAPDEVVTALENLLDG